MLPITKYLTKHHAALALITSYLILIPFRRAEIPMALMAVAGLVLMVRHRRELWQRQEVVLFSLLFAAIWLPMAISLIGAVNPEKTLSTTAAFLRFYPAGIFVILTLAVAGAPAKLLRILAWVLLIWVLDALLQAVTGYNSLGYPQPGRVNGFFGSGIHFGMFMATLSPLLLVHAYRKWPLPAQIATLAGVASVIFMSGTRGGWVSLAVVLGGLAVWVLWREGVRASLPRLVVAVVVFGLVGAGTLYCFPQFSDRVDKTMLAFTGDTELLDKALSDRLPIWSTGVKMIQAHPLNGVGARNFRYAYDEFAEPDDYWAGEGVTAAHAHQIVLDVASETGVVGLGGFLVVVWLLARAWRRADPHTRQIMLPYALALLTVFFPLNSHYATYSTAWSSTYFWLLALFCAVSAPPAKAAVTEADVAQQRLAARQATTGKLFKA